jgi:hypothetical protein
MDTAKRTERMADAHHAFAAVGEGAILQRRACKLGFLCRSESGGLKRISLAQEQERTPGYAIGDPSVTGSRPPSPSLDKHFSPRKVPRIQNQRCMKASMELRHDLGVSDVPPRDGTAAPWTPRRGARLRPTVCSRRTTLSTKSTCSIINFFVVYNTTTRCRRCQVVSCAASSRA